MIHAQPYESPMPTRLRRITDLREFMILYILILGVIGISHAVPEFLGGQNLSAILLSLSDPGIIAIGMTLLLVSGLSPFCHHYITPWSRFELLLSLGFREGAYLN